MGKKRSERTQVLLVRLQNTYLLIKRYLKICWDKIFVRSSEGKREEMVLRF